MRELCERKGVKSVREEVCPDHARMLVESAPKLSVSSFMGYLKGKSGRCSMNNMENCNTNIGAESSEAGDTTWIQRARMQAA